MTNIIPPLQFPTEKERKREHKIIAWIVLPPILALTLALTTAFGVGAFRAITSHQGQITIQRTGSMYQDCETFAQARGYAIDVCEPLNPASATAQVNCATEMADDEAPVDCPSTLKP